ncbi:MAG: hypothetical protein ACI8TL_000913 [Natronomonas sp.]|jgi:hypothetical protein
MSNEPREYYTDERWQNWIDRLREEEIDPEEEDSARLLLNLQDDTAIAVAKIITDYDDDMIDEDRTLSELEDIQQVVLSEVEFENEEKAMLIDGVQTSLMCVFHAAQEYVVGGPAEDGTIEEYIEAAAEAEKQEELDAALGYCVQAGTLVIDGEKMDIGMADELEFGLVAEWVNGIDSLQTALRDPEVVEEE